MFHKAFSGSQVIGPLHRSRRNIPFQMTGAREPSSPPTKMDIGVALSRQPPEPLPIREEPDNGVPTSHRWSHRCSRASAGLFLDLFSQPGSDLLVKLIMLLSEHESRSGKVPLCSASSLAARRFPQGAQLSLPDA